MSSAAASSMAPRTPRRRSTRTPIRPPTQNDIMQMVKVTFTADISQPYMSASGVANSDHAYTSPSTRNDAADVKR